MEINSLITESLTLIPASEEHPVLYPTILYETDNRKALAVVQHDSYIFGASLAEFYSTPSLTLYWAKRLVFSSNNYEGFGEFDIAGMTDEEILANFRAYWISWDQTSEGSYLGMGSDPFVYIVMKDPETGEWVGCGGYNALLW